MSHWAEEARREPHPGFVQRRAAPASAPDGAVHEAAKAGTSGAGGQLPHLDAIQRSFGRHDVSKVEAHTGAQAMAGAKAMGAEAFATGNQVAFAGAPSLHTAAHEAAHVVQQRGGVQLKGGVGEAGDVHEQHADRVADAVVAGRSAEPILDEAGNGSGSGVMQRYVQRTGKPEMPGSTFMKRPMPEGAAQIDLQVDVPRLPPELTAELGVAAGQVSVRLTFTGTAVLLGLQHGSITLVASLDLSRAIEMLLGPALQVADALADKLKRGADFAASIAKQLSAPGASRVRIDLWQDKGGKSFIIVDVARAIAVAWSGGGADGLRPIEAHLQLGGAGRVDVFGGGEIAANQALPSYEKLGDFAIDDGGGLRRNVLGLDDGGGVVTHVYFGDGKLAVAVTPDAKATTGAVAEIDLLYLLGKLKALGEKIWSLLKAAFDAILKGAKSLLSFASGLLRFDLGGGFKSFLEFDFHLSLPKFGKGGGFNLGSLWPSSWSIDLGGLRLGTMPKLDWPWVRWPKLGSFSVDLPRLSGLLAGFGMPSLPALPSVDFDLHLEGLNLGLGFDLSRLWPDLDWGKGGSTFGFDLDLGTLLEKIARVAGAIGRAAKKLLDLLVRAGKAIARWIHIGTDGVIRIFDDQDRSPEKPMLGFSLLRLLDGVDATDLTPVEVRYHSKEGDLDLGLAGLEGGKPGGELRSGQATPRRPAGRPIIGDTLSLPDHVSTAMGVTADASAQVDVYWQHDELIVFAEAASAHRAGHEALRLAASTARMREALVARMSAKGPKPRLEPHLVPRDLGGVKAIGIELVEPGADPKKSKAYGLAVWRLQTLLAADDLGGLEPEQFSVQLGDHLGFSRAPFTPPPGLLGHFDLDAPDVRRDMLLQTDGGKNVSVGVYYNVDKHDLAISATPTSAVNDGVLAHVNLVWLLQQLEKLGALGEKVLDALAHMLGKAYEGAKGFGAKIAQLVAWLGSKLPKLDGFRLDFDFSGSGFLRWDLSRLRDLFRSNGSIDFSGLIPDFSGLRFPGLPGFSLSLLPSIDFDGDLLGKIPLPSLKLSKLFEGLGGIDWPKVDLDFEVFGLDGGLGISIDLSFLKDLLGSGGRKLSFHIDLEKILAPFQKAWQWLKKKFPKRISKTVNPNVSLGKDGVLRLWDDIGHAKIGFDLFRLLDGFQASDVVPVEMEFGVETGGHGKPKEEVATFELGKAAGTDEKPTQAGQVLATRPGGKAAAKLDFPAPDVISEHLGVKKGTMIHAELFDVGKDAVLFASMKPSDRGIEIHVNQRVLASLAEKLGPKSKGLGGANILWDLCGREHGIVIGFGRQPDAKTKPEDVQPHGRAVWKLSRFFDGFDLGDLVPDVFHVESKDVAFDIGVGIDVSDLPKVYTPLTLPEEPSWIRDALQSPDAEVRANASEKRFRLALVAASASKADKGTSRRGVELQVSEHLVDTIETKVAKLAHDASVKIGGMLSKSRAAGKLVGGEFADRGLRLHPTAHGLKVEHGEEGEQRHMYATFGWPGLVDAVTKADASGLVPAEFRLATNSLAAEVKEVDVKTSTSMPEKAKRIGGMHELFRNALGMFGLEGNQYIDLDLEASPVVPTGDGGHTVKLTGTVYTPETDPGKDRDHAPGVAIAHAKSVSLSVSLEAVLAQVLPKGRKFDNKNDGRKQKKGVSMSVGYKRDLTPDLGGVELDMKATLGKSDKERTFEIKAGWTVAKLLEIVMNLEDLVGPDATASSALGLLTPDVIKGSYSNKLFTLDIGNAGKKVGTEIDAPSVPFLTDILEAFVDEETANNSKLHLEVPDQATFIKSFGKALKDGERVKIGQAALEIPAGQGKPPRIYTLELKLSLIFLKKIAGFIPYLGIAIKIVDGVRQIAKDPKGFAEGIIYTPELMYHFFKNAPEIVDRLRDMSAKDIAVAFLMDDSTNKQAVYAARLKEKLEAAGFHPGKNMTEAEKKAAMAQGLGTDEQLKWLNEQDPAALMEAQEIYKSMKKLGIEKNEEKPDFSQKLNVQALKDLRDAVQAGYTEFAEAYENEQKLHADPNASDADKAAAKARVEETEQKLRATVAQRIAAGTTKLDWDKAREKSDAQRPDAPSEVASIKDVKKPDADQVADAQSIFKDAKSGDGLDQTSADYLIEKYAFLTNGQLGELLATGQTKLTAEQDPGRERVWIMPKEEAAFVRLLFVRRVDPKEKTIKTTNDPSAKASTDQEIVDAWKRREEARKKAAKAQAKQDAREKAKQEKKAKKPKAPGDKGDGAGQGDEWEEPESFGDAFEESENEQLEEMGVLDGKDKKDGEHKEEKKRPITPAKGDPAGGPPQQPGKKDDAHLFARVVEKPKFVFFNEGTKTIDKEPDWQQIVKKYEQKSSTGARAGIEDFEIENYGNVASDGDPPIYKFRLVLDVWVDGYENHTETYERAYRPDTGKVMGFAEPDTATRKSVSESFRVRGDKVEMTGKTLLWFGTSFKVMRVNESNKVKAGGYNFITTLRVLTLSKAGERIGDVDGKYVSLKPGVIVTVRLHVDG